MRPDASDIVIPEGRGLMDPAKLPEHSVERMQELLKEAERYANNEPDRTQALATIALGWAASIEAEKSLRQMGKEGLSRPRRAQYSGMTPRARDDCLSRARGRGVWCASGCRRGPYGRPDRRWW